MNRSEECEYDDKKQKSRTQKLREKLLLLEERVRELESDSIASTSNSGSALPAFTPSPESSVSSPSETAQLFMSPEIPGLGTSSLADFDSLPSPFSPFDGPTWPAVASSSAPSSSSSLYAPFYLAGTSGNETLSLVNPSLNVEDYDSEQSVHNCFEMSPFTGLSASGSTFPYMSRWDPKDPLPYENKRIL